MQDIEKAVTLLDLSSQVVIVTGAGRGIGRGIALRLASAGARIVACDLNGKDCADTCTAITAGGGHALAVTADVTLAEDQHRIVATAITAFGGIDILVNNAALRGWVKWDELTENDWDRGMAVNQRAVFFLTSKVAVRMVKQGRGGSIINIASTAAIHPVRDKVDYTAAKAAVVGMTRSLAVELGPASIRVNAVGPGGTRTQGGTGSVVSDEIRKMGEQWAARMPWPKKIADPDDIARVVLFFASPLSGFVTGQVLYVDGGYLVG